jgi:TetR/AcrR family transcriptional repressor of mexJK operon
MPKPRLPNPPGRPKDLEKRAAILESAKALFPVRGYDGTSMDAIARSAGVSKLTVYSHFQDKDTLFVEAVRAKCEEILPSDLFVPRFDGPIRGQLLRIGHAFFRLVTSDESIAMHRIMSSQLPEGSHLPALFWEAGPRRTVEALAAFIAAEDAAGELSVPDPGLAASQFLCLLKGEHHARMICGCHVVPSAPDVERHVEATVDLFLRAYGPAHR